MTTKLDIVGHFGTTFSYATVASKVAHALVDGDRLGMVTNLDPTWHPSHERLEKHASHEKGSHVLVVAAPNHYFDVFPEYYGRERSALFVSPNADRMCEEHTKTCTKFGMLLAPSSHCKEVVEASIEAITPMDLTPAAFFGEQKIYRLPLGVDDALFDDHRPHAHERQQRILGAPRVLHFSTDHYWPGRKGTQEVLLAWKALKEQPMSMSEERGELLVHVPSAMYADTVHRVRQLDVDDSVSVRRAWKRGGGDDLADLIEWADMMVAPSRCEGFGIMLLSALVAGLPLVTVPHTGQVDFLRKLPGGWLGVPAFGLEKLHGEEGLAPKLEVGHLLATMRLAMLSSSRDMMLRQLALQDQERSEWRWSLRAQDYAALLTGWMRETAQGES